MIKNYFRTAWRNLLKNRSSSLINIIGLAAGMWVAILIGLWVYDEISFDKNFDNHNRIARVIQNVTNNGQVQTWDNVPYPLAEELRKNYGSDFKQVVMGANWGDHFLSLDDKKLKLTGAYFEKGMPAMFSLKMLNGSHAALEEPASIIISASTAKAYFANNDPVNKMMKIDDLPVVKVTGVYEDFPRNSTLAGLNFIAPWDFFYSNSAGFKDMEDPWRPNFTSLFVQLNDNVDIAAVSLKIKDAKLKKVNEQLQKKSPALFLHPMSKWHLYGEFKEGKNTGGAIQYVWMFGIIGGFVLLLACINFMNLSTARSEKRAKEVGIRKTIGSVRKQLIFQFFSESLLTVFLSFIVALLLVQLSLSFFNEVSAKQLYILWNNGVFWCTCLVFIIATALVAGSYPAFYLSSFRPVKVLKGTFKAGRFASVPRKVLVVSQFTVSVILIIGTIIVYRQIQFGKERPVGYSRTNLISIPTAGDAIHAHFDAVKNELIQNGTIVSIAESESPTTGVWNTTSGFSWPGKDPNLSTDFGVVAASYDYGTTIDWQVKEGRGFSKDFVTDSSSMVLNEAAAKYMGLTKTVGETVSWWGNNYRVIGIIDNMVIESPYGEPRPMLYVLSNQTGNMALLKLNPSVSAASAVNKIETVFKKFNPAQPFEYKFVDEEYAAKFGAEERVGKLATFFALLAIAISCLGLFGLTSFVAEQRRKEIGVRKVLGASVLNVLNLLSRDFALLVLISFLIAVPLSYYFMHNWLQHYAYRTEIQWWIFAAAGVILFLLTLLTVGYQGIKAAIANPVKSLRTE